MLQLFDNPQTPWYHHLDKIKSGEIPLRAISLNNPYCTLMHNGKTLETRKYKTNVRGLVLFCSCGKQFPKNKVIETSGGKQFNRIVKALDIKYDKDICNTFLDGYMLSIGNLVGSRPMKPSDENNAFVNHLSDRWVWQIEDCRPIVPVPYKGKQGWRLFDVVENPKDYEILQQIQLL